MIEKVQSWFTEGAWVPYGIMIALASVILYAGEVKQQLTDLQQFKVQMGMEHGAILHEMSDIKVIEAADQERQKAQDERLNKLEKR